MMCEMQKYINYIYSFVGILFYCRQASDADSGIIILSSLILNVKNDFNSVF